MPAPNESDNGTLDEDAANAITDEAITDEDGTISERAEQETP